jgi:uncharacterized membrane protein YphA (DoxX/SURF4 family)
MKVGKTDQLQGWGVTVLRVATGTLFLVSGVRNLVLEHSGQLGGLLFESNVVVVGWLVELFGGAALVVELLTRWVSIPLAFLMLTNILLVHPPVGFYIEDKGLEYASLRLAASGA